MSNTCVEFLSLYFGNSHNRTSGKYIDGVVSWPSSILSHDRILWSNSENHLVSQVKDCNSLAKEDPGIYGFSSLCRLVEWGA